LISNTSKAKNKKQKDGVAITFCPGWPQTKILLISTSLVVRIRSMNHCIQSGFALLSNAEMVITMGVLVMG
jgi:hypothetical protein